MREKKKKKKKRKEANAPQDTAKNAESKWALKRYANHEDNTWNGLRHLN